MQGIAYAVIHFRDVKITEKWSAAQTKNSSAAKQKRDENSPAAPCYFDFVWISKC